MRFFFEFTKKYAGGSLNPTAESYYIHVQPTLASVWNISHGLGNYIYFQAFDNTGKWVQPSTAEMVGLNGTRLTWPVAKTGICYCKRDNTHVYSRGPMSTWVVSHASGVNRMACVWENDSYYVVPSLEENVSVNQIQLQFPSAIQGTVVLIEQELSTIMTPVNPFTYIHNKHKQVMCWTIDTANERSYPSEFEIINMDSFDTLFPLAQTGSTVGISY